MAVRLDSKFPFLHRITIGTGGGAGNTDMLTFDYWYDKEQYQTSGAGVQVTKSTALKLAAYWRAVNLLSSQIGSFPIGLYKRLPSGDTEEITDHSAIYLLKTRPNMAMNPLIWRESMQANALVHGNGYSFIERNGTGDPIALVMMDSEKTEPRTNGRELVYVSSSRTIDPYNVLHIPSLILDGVEGKAILDAAAESMGVGLAMQKYTANFWKNGAKQTGVLMHPLSLSDEARSGLRKSFDKKMKDKDGGTMLLDEGMKYHPTSIPPVQAQLLDSERFSVQEMARWFGIPPHLLFEESRSTFNNIAEQGMEFVRYTLTQWVSRWEAELNIKLLTSDQAKDHFFKLNMDSLLRGDLKSRYEAYALGIQNSFLSPNEARRKEDLNSIPGGDIYAQQMNMQPLGKKDEDGE